MKKLKLMLLVLCTQFCINNINAQAHTFKHGWCKFAPPSKSGKAVQAEIASYVCQACNLKKEKEYAAKKVEDKRRADVAKANYEAIKAAEKKVTDDALAEKKATTERRKIQGEKDRIENEAILKKGREIADNGAIKTEVKKVISNTIGDLRSVEFVNHQNKTFGFKVDNIVKFEQSFAGESCFFTRFNKTNYFILRTYVKKGNEEKEIVNIVDLQGKILKIKGLDNFSTHTYYKEGIRLFRHKTDPEFVRNWASNTFDNYFYEDKQSAINEITKDRRGYSIGCEETYVTSTKCLFLNENLEILAEDDGYLITAKWSRCKY